MLNPNYDVNKLPLAEFFLLDDFGKELLEYFNSNPVKDFNPATDYEGNKDQIQKVIDKMPLRLGHDAYHLPLSPVDVYYINRKLHGFEKEGFEKTFGIGTYIGAVTSTHSIKVQGENNSLFPFIFSAILREAKTAGFDVGFDDFQDIEKLFSLGLILSSDPRNTISNESNYGNILNIIIGVLNRYRTSKYLIKEHVFGYVTPAPLDV